MVDTTKILKEYRVTEKSSILNEQFLQYTFEVAKDANKAQISEAIEQIFDVKVARVNVINKKAKFKANIGQILSSANTFGDDVSALVDKITKAKFE